MHNGMNGKSWEMTWAGKFLPGISKYRHVPTLSGAADGSPFSILSRPRRGSPPPALFQSACLPEHEQPPPLQQEVTWRCPAPAR